MSAGRPELLTFREAYFERIWGGRRLGGSLGRPVPAGKVTGEAWLISDHDECQSVVNAGPWKGKTLGQLMAECPEYLLGTRARPTPRGQFPLLLKLIDAGEALSVQVHPDDETARRLNEPDVGKTEMWHVLEADPGAELVCGLVPGTTREGFAQAVAEGRVAQCMTHFPAPAGTSVFVPAGTVHAIGGGILLAEIQQNSNITYRVYDWDRTDAAGNRRELHLEKAEEAIHFDAGCSGPSEPLTLESDGAHREALGACRYFAAERVKVARSWRRAKGTGTFHLVVAATDTLNVLSGDCTVCLKKGAALLVPGGVAEYGVEGQGTILVYYVPSFSEDVLEQFAETRRSGTNNSIACNLSDWDLSDEAISLLHANVAGQYKVVPLGLKGGIFYVATAAPDNLAVLDNVGRLVNTTAESVTAVEPVPMSEQEVRDALNKYYRWPPVQIMITAPGENNAETLLFHNGTD